MSATNLLFLDSRDAELIDDTPSDMIFTLNFNSGRDMENYAISLQSIVLPNTVYPINSYNNKIYWTEDLADLTTSTIPTNNYTGTEMAIALATVFNADSPNARTYTVSYNSQNKKFLLTETVGLPNTVEFYYGTNDIFDEIGINANGTSHSTTYEFDYPVNLSGSEYLDIQTDINSRNYSSSGKSNILDRIPLNVSFGEVLLYNNNTDDYVSLNEDSITTIEIRILNDRGQLWALPKNNKVSVVLKMAILN